MYHCNDCGADNELGWKETDDGTDEVGCCALCDSIDITRIEADATPAANDA